MAGTVNNTVYVDMRVGGLGDIWMRLAALFSLSGLVQTQYACIVPAVIRGIAQNVFGDRVAFADEHTRSNLLFTNRGIRHLLPGILTGRRYLAPYHRLTAKDWGRNNLKNSINRLGFELFDKLELIGIAPCEVLENYQGYVEMMCIASLRTIDYSRYLEQAAIDYEIICARLQQQSASFAGAAALSKRVVVFPSGSGHQVMTGEFAASNLAGAVFCFHENDSYSSIFERQAGTGTVEILKFGRPSDIVDICNSAAVVVTTDSFPSHLIQFLKVNSIIILAEQPATRIIAPHYRGRFLSSLAPCSPCPHLARVHKCKAGFDFCLTWQNGALAESLRRELQNFGADLRSV